MARRRTRARRGTRRKRRGLTKGRSTKNASRKIGRRRRTRSRRGGQDGESNYPIPTQSSENRVLEPPAIPVQSYLATRGP